MIDHDHRQESEAFLTWLDEQGALTPLPAKSLFVIRDRVAERISAARASGAMTAPALAAPPADPAPAREPDLDDGSVDAEPEGTESPEVTAEPQESPPGAGTLAEKRCIYCCGRYTSAGRACRTCGNRKSKEYGGSHDLLMQAMRFPTCAKCQGKRECDADGKWPPPSHCWTCRPPRGANAGPR